MRFLIVAFLLAISPVRAQERELNGTTLLDECVRDTPFCNGYIIGAQEITQGVDGRLKTTAMNQYRDVSWCVPKGATYQQMRLVLIKWMQENPKVLHLATPSLVAAAFTDAWPCTQK